MEDMIMKNKDMPMHDAMHGEGGRAPSGQVMQEGMEPQEQDMNPAGTSQGTGLPTLSFVDGKSGSVQKMSMVQTGFTKGPGSESA